MFNDGCTELAKYLFYGLYGRNQPSLEQALEEIPEEMLDGEFYKYFSLYCIYIVCVSTLTHYMSAFQMLSC